MSAPLPSPSSTDQTGRGFTTGLVLALALVGVLGLIGGAVGYSAVKRKQVDVRKGWNLVPVVVASVDIAEGTVVTMEMISQRSVPEQFVTSSVVKPDSASYVVNQRSAVPMQAGDLLLWSSFDTSKANERPSVAITDTQRLVSIKVSAETGAGGWVRPGEKVDVIATYPDPDTRALTVTTLLSDVTVLTTSARFADTQPKTFTSVTVLVQADDAERLALMQSIGTLSLSLRAETGTDAPRRKPRSLREVVGPAPPRPAN